MQHLFKIFCLICFCSVLTAQSPLEPVCTFNYQGVVRDVNDAVLPNRAIKVQFTILDGPGGNELYIEQHDATTTSLGLVNLEIGDGDLVGGSLIWDAIPWAIRRHYLRIEIDPNGGSNFELLGESPILAVPIAVQAKVAAFAVQTLDTIKVYDTLRVRSICVDTLKAELACIDTIKAGVGLIDTLITEIGVIDKIFTEDVCLEDGNGVSRSILFADPEFGDLRLDIDKINTSSLCFVDIDGNPVGGISELLGTTFAQFDFLTGCTFFDTLKTAGSIDIFGNGDEPIGRIGRRPDGTSGIDIGSIDAEDILSNTISTDSLTANVLCVDELKTNTFCSTETFNVKNILGESVFSIEPNEDLDYTFNLVGNVMIQGGIAAEFKQFLIDHPLDPDRKYLRHFSIESDRMTNIYNGTVTLDESGAAMVQLPDWFEGLNTDFSYQLTCIGGFANVYIAEEVKGNQFHIAGGRAGMKVSWQVTGIRHDRQALEQALPVEGWKTPQQ